MTTQLKTLFYVIALFLAGAITGGVVGACTAKRLMFLHPPRPHDLAQHLRAQLHTRLGLTPEQERRIDPILDQTDSQLKAIHREAMAKVSQAIDQTHSRIAAELTPEQQAKLKQLEKERREFMNRRPRGQRVFGRNPHHDEPDEERPPGPAPSEEPSASARPGPL